MQIKMRPPSLPFHGILHLEITCKQQSGQAAKEQSVTNPSHTFSSKPDPMIFTSPVSTALCRTELIGVLLVSGLLPLGLVKFNVLLWLDF